MDSLIMNTALMYVLESCKYYFRNLSCFAAHTRDKVFKFETKRLLGF